MTPNTCHGLGRAGSPNIWRPPNFRRIFVRVRVLGLAACMRVMLVGWHGLEGAGAPYDWLGWPDRRPYRIGHGTQCPMRGNLKNQKCLSGATTGFSMKFTLIHRKIIPPNSFDFHPSHTHIATEITSKTNTRQPKPNKPASRLEYCQATRPAPQQPKETAARAKLSNKNTGAPTSPLTHSYIANVSQKLKYNRFVFSINSGHAVESDGRLLRKPGLHILENVWVYNIEE